MNKEKIHQSRDERSVNSELRTTCLQWINALFSPREIKTSKTATKSRESNAQILAARLHSSCQKQIADYNNLSRIRTFRVHHSRRHRHFDLLDSHKHCIAVSLEMELSAKQDHLMFPHAEVDDWLDYDLDNSIRLSEERGNWQGRVTSPKIQNTFFEWIHFVLRIGSHASEMLDTFFAQEEVTDKLSNRHDKIRWFDHHGYWSIREKHRSSLRIDLLFLRHLHSLFSARSACLTVMLWKSTHNVHG